MPFRKLHSEENIFLLTGRIDLATFWGRAVIAGLIYALIYFVAGLTSVWEGFSSFVILVYLPWGFALMNAIKRIHDIGYGGLAVVILSWLPIYLIIPGEKKDNQYGPDPLREPDEENQD